MTIRQLAAAGFACLAMAGPSTGAEERSLRGRVIDGEGRPVAGAQVSYFWMTTRGEVRPFDAAKTDVEGRFRLRAKFPYGHHQPLLALDGDRRRGGLVVLDDKAAEPTCEIRVGPMVTVRGSFSCKEAGGPPSWMNIYMNLATGDRAGTGLLARLRPEAIRIASCDTRTGDFAYMLPAGTYQFDAYGSDVVPIKRWLTLKADQPVLDLGAIDLKSTPTGLLYGKAPPTLQIAEARGVPKDVKLDDYKGKWVVLEFWATWCGPCVYQGLPRWMEFADEFADRRDEFAILTVHHPSSPTLADVDKKMAPLVKEAWKGRPLPFPILLDSSGKTFEAFGVRGIPDDVLIDPEGRLVKTPRGTERFLREKLGGKPSAGEIARALDRDVNLHLEQTPLEEAVEYFSGIGQIPIKLDLEGLKAAGASSRTAVPLTFAGKLSLRSWLDLSLEPLGLTARPDPDGLVITRRAPDEPLADPTPRQRDSARRLEALLAKPLEFEVRDGRLADLVTLLTDKAESPFCLDPSACRAGTLNPEAAISGKGDGKPLGEALSTLLRPLGLTYAIRDEAVVIVPGPKSGP